MPVSDAFRHQAAHLTPFLQRHRRQPGQLRLDALAGQPVAVHLLRDLLGQPQVDRCQRGHRPGDADQLTGICELRQRRCDRPISLSLRAC